MADALARMSHCICWIPSTLSATGRPRLKTCSMTILTAGCLSIASSCHGMSRGAEERGSPQLGRARTARRLSSFKPLSIRHAQVDGPPQRYTHMMPHTKHRKRHGPARSLSFPRFIPTCADTINRILPAKADARQRATSSHGVLGKYILTRRHTLAPFGRLP